MAKILIIEDDKSIRDMYAYKIRLGGLEVFEAANGLEGLKLAESKHPDIILLDLLMPVMDGHTMLRKLRDQEWAHNILVIILTNVSQDEAPMDMRHLKVEKYIVKAHSTPKHVLEIVQEILKRYKKLA